MSTSQLVDFLNKTQRDPRLNEILYPYANPARAKELICQYEPNKFNAQKGQLSLDGFMRLVYYYICMLCMVPMYTLTRYIGVYIIFQIYIFYKTCKFSQLLRWYLQ